MLTATTVYLSSMFVIAIIVFYVFILFYFIYLREYEIQRASPLLLSLPDTY